MKELREAQDYTAQLQQDADDAEEKLYDANRELSEFRLITKCSNTNELRIWMDSQQGRVVTANALIEGFRKEDPELLARIIG